MLKENTSDSFPGANYVARDPIAPAECCAYWTVAGLLPRLVGEGKPYIFRGGRLYFEATPAELAAICAGWEPEPTAFSADPLIPTDPYYIAGTLFGAAEGRFWLTDAAAWGEEVYIQEQAVIAWAADKVDFTATQDSLPLEPTPVYGYVETACGMINQVGVEGHLGAGK